ncbi:MAG: hypothetical protein WA830_03920 [Candidatus Sulfotelmatobacter sp.]
MSGLRTSLRGLWEIIWPYKIRWGIEQQPARPMQESEMTRSITELDVCTNEQLEQVLAGLLTQARGQVLSDAEVQEFWRVYQEIQRRSGIAA